MKGIVGVELKAQITNFTQYIPTVGGQTAIGQYHQEAVSKKMVKVIDQLVMDTGTIDLHLSSFLYTDPDTGADAAQTHKSGFIMDMDKMGLAYSRKPRVIRKPYDGGGQKAIVDAIFMQHDG
jgi:hypothetical protein